MQSWCGLAIIRDPGSFYLFATPSSVYGFSPAGPRWLHKLQPSCSHLSQEEGGMKRRRAYAFPLNTLLGSHTLHLCSHLIDLINLVTYPYLAARKGLGKTDFISAKNCGYFHWKRNGDQVLQNYSHFFCTYTDRNKFEINIFPFTEETGQKFLSSFF